MARELTREEKAAIRSLVVKWCANYDRACGCLPLDCECYMLGKCWTGAYCRYFREAILPLDPALEAALLTEGPRPDFKPCPGMAEMLSTWKNGTLGQSVPKSQAVMLEEVSMEKQKDQEFAHLEVKRLCGVFGAPLPPVEEKPVDKIKEPPRPYRSREREER